ncbi:MAG: hypothetical protein V1779_07090 [bacterium]
MKKKLKIAMFIVFVLISLISLIKIPKFPSGASDGFVQEWIETSPDKINQ